MLAALLSPIPTEGVFLSHSAITDHESESVCVCLSVCLSLSSPLLLTLTKLSVWVSDNCISLFPPLMVLVRGVVALSSQVFVIAWACIPGNLCQLMKISTASRISMYV